MESDNEAKRHPQQGFPEITLARLQHLLTAGPAVIYSRIPQPPYATTFISNNAQIGIGYTPKDFINHPDFWIEQVHLEDRGRVLSEMETLFRYDELWCEYRFRCGDGTYRWMHDEQRLMRDSKGHPLEIVGYWIDISKRKQAETALKRHQEFLQTLLDRIPLMVNHFDEGRLQWANQEFERFLGWPLEEAKRIDILRACYPDSTYRQQVMAFIREASGQWKALRTRLRNGQTLETNWVYIKLSDGSTVGIGQNLTERKQAEQTKKWFAAILEATPDFVAFINPQGQLLYVNPAGRKMLGVDRTKVLHQPITTLYPDWVHSPYHNEILPAVIHKGVWQGEFALRHREGYEIPVSVVILAHRTPQQEVEFFSAIARDIREHKAYEAELERQANYDILTGLPNRNLLQERLSHALARAQRNQRWIAVLWLDLDRFKLVNDSLGHPAGDALLQAVATRLSTSLREEDTVARLGGDEFVIVLENLPKKTAVKYALRKVLDTLKAPFQLEGQEFFIGVSIGISLFPQDGEEAHTLLKQADIALQRAKAQGRRGVQFYTPDMSAETSQRLSLESNLRRALERGELTLHYQPQVSLESGRVTGVEALLYWRHPCQGLISPAQFIPFAEESGLIASMGEWALGTACAQAKAWQKAGLEPLTVAVNLSARQFLQANLVEHIAQVLQHSGLAATWLKLEITESLLMHDVNGAIETLQALKEMGIRVAIDDFGTGYSSLNYLKRFPLDQLKIDRSFVRDITRNPDDAAIAQAVIAMAHSLKLEVIAEGVENEAQVAFLRAKGCHAIQGYYISRPLPSEQLALLVGENRCWTLTAGAHPNNVPMLLLVNDDPLTATTLQRRLRGEPYRLLTCHSALEGLGLLACYPIGVVLAAPCMPKINGIGFLRRVEEIYPEIVRIALTSQNAKAALGQAANEGAVFKCLDTSVSAEHLKAVLKEAFLLHDALRQSSRSGS